jgi:OTT_1508-like deaminase
MGPVVSLLLTVLSSCLVGLTAVWQKYETIPVSETETDETADTALGVKRDAVAEALQQEASERQRELNDNLALIRILDPLSPFSKFLRTAPEPRLRSSTQRRHALLNFIAFCLARDNNTVALATTIHQHGVSPNCENKVILHVARSTGSTTSYEREGAYEFLIDIKRAWRYQTYWHMQIVLGHVVQMTWSKLRKRLKKLRDALYDLQDSEEFSQAIDSWGKEESSPDVIRWMNTWVCESPNAALKDIAQRLLASAESENFDTPYEFDATWHSRLHHSYLFPVAVLLASQFFSDVESGRTSLAPGLVSLIRQLRRRCVKVRWYEIGIHLLCTWGRDSLRRILGAGAFNKFVCSEEDDALTIDWLETPNAMPDPMPRRYETAQDALVNMLATISEGSDEDEPFACSIRNKLSAITYWTPTCVVVYHPELQIIDHLRRSGVQPSPAYVGCSKLACRACKIYVDHLHDYKWSLYTGGLHTMDLETPTDWLMPPSDAGLLCTSIIREEAARLVLREDNIQRIAWEMHSASETLGLDDPETTVDSDAESALSSQVFAGGGGAQIAK